jgi:hypothetical protein
MKKHINKLLIKTNSLYINTLNKVKLINPTLLIKNTNQIFYILKKVYLQNKSNRNFKINILTDGKDNKKIIEKFLEILKINKFVTVNKRIDDICSNTDIILVFNLFDNYDAKIMLERLFFQKDIKFIVNFTRNEYIINNSFGIYNIPTDLSNIKNLALFLITLKKILLYTKLKEDAKKNKKKNKTKNIL